MHTNQYYFGRWLFMKAKSLLQNDNREQLCVFNTMTEVKKETKKPLKV